MGRNAGRSAPRHPLLNHWEGFDYFLVRQDHGTDLKAAITVIIRYYHVKGGIR
jgi:hypothetical protein